MIYRNLFRKRKKILMSFKWTFQIAIAIFIIWVYFNPQTKLHSIIAISLMLIFYLMQSYIENNALVKFINEKQADHEGLISAICNSSQDLIIYKDFNGKYLYCNQTFLNKINKTLDEIRGKKELDLFPKEDAKTLSKISKKVLQGNVVKKTIKLVNSSNIYDLTASPLVLTKGVFGVLIIARDINAEKTSAEQRETYVATLTHDLKTPTIAQIKALDLLLNNQMGPLNNEQRELLLLTRDSCNFMYEMLSTLLSTYKYENGDYTLNYENCNIISLIEETVNELESMQKEKNVTIHINKEGSVFNTDCDRMQIKRVLTNILGNAISYAYNNTPIHISIKQTEKGIGVETKNKSSYINSETMSNLFKKYVSHAAKFNKVGVGLGLYLSKQIMDAHNGDIYAKSFEDNHNIFGFVLPIVGQISSI